MPAEGGDPETADLQSRRGPGRRLDAGRRRRRLPLDVREHRRPRPQPLFRERQGRRRRDGSRSTAASSPASRPTAGSSSTAARGNEEYYWKRYKGGQYQDIWMYDFEAKKFTPVSDYVGKNATRCGSAIRCISSPTGGTASPTSTPRKSGTKDIKPVTSIRRLRRHDALHGRQNDRLRPGRLPPSPRRQDEPVAEDQGHGRLPTAGRSAAADDQSPRLHPRRQHRQRRQMAVSSRPGATFSPFPAGQGADREPLQDARNARNVSRPSLRTARPSPSSRTRAATTSSTRRRSRAANGRSSRPNLDRSVYHLLWSPDGKKILFGNKDFAIFYRGRRHEKARQDRRVQPDEKRRILLGDQRLRLVARQQLDRLQLRPVQPQQPDLPLQPGPGQKIRRDGRFLRQPQSLLRRQRQLPLLSLEPEFRRPDGLLRRQPCHRNAAAGHGRPAPGRRKAAVRRSARPAEKASRKPTKSRARAVPDRHRRASQKRTYPLPVAAGNYFYLKAGKGKAVWCSVDQFTEDEYEEIFKPRGATKWALHVFDMADKKEVVLNDKIREFGLSTNGEQLISGKDADIFATSVDKAFDSKTLGERLNLQGLTYAVDLQKEWNQIFNDAWRWYRDFFYDANFHGRDWKAMGEKYRAYIPQLSSRDELNWVLSQMVGELCVSHTYIGGGDLGPLAAPSSPVFTGLLGADLVPDEGGLLQIRKDLRADRNQPRPQRPARPARHRPQGGRLPDRHQRHDVKADDDYFKLLQRRPAKRSRSRSTPSPRPRAPRPTRSSPSGATPALRYFRWLVGQHQEDREGDRRQGRLHAHQRHGLGGIGEFDKFWRAFRY